MWVGRGGERGSRRVASRAALLLLRLGRRLAEASSPRARTLPCSQKLPPPHSLHLLRTLPCSQMPVPPHSLHWLRCLPCSQKPEPPHSLHLLRTLPCSQMLAPPHSLHWLRCLPCSQMHPPPHSLHALRTLPCSQMLPPPHSFLHTRFADALPLAALAPCTVSVPALLAPPSLPPVLADPFPRTLLAEIPSPTHAVHARVAGGVHPDLARTLPERRRHVGTRGRS